MIDIVMSFILVFILIYTLKRYFNPSFNSSHGCDCEGRSYELVEKVYNNKIYKCTICGTRDHLISHKLSSFSINKRMREWYIKESFKIYRDDENKS